MSDILKQKPVWLKAKLPGSPQYQAVREIVEKNKLNTVCQSAQCPNMGECWSRGTATVMILGNVCTRSCTFCAIQTGRPEAPDIGEPARVAEAIAKMGLKHAVITSVARDDLKDGGASVWAATIRAVRYRNPNTAIEVLIPDLRGAQENLNTILDARPDILNHNIETVERLQRPIRKTAQYARTMWVLEHSKKRGFVTKSSMMLGLGEQEEEIAQTLRDLRKVQCDILTLGQYLQPSSKYAPIDRWVTPEEFARWKEYALSIGFGVVESGPLVRSSYHAEEQSERYGLSAIRKQLEKATG
jgi:lipoyl synthase